MNRAFFLDRDGVINTEAVCLWQADKTELIPNAAPAIRKLRAAGYIAVVVSNQPWVERQVCSIEDQWRVFARIQARLYEAGTRLDAFYFCPHSPGITDCDCRKPAPGLLLKAARDLGIDPAASFMVGDRFTDLEAGRRAGCRGVGLVKTGCGLRQLEKYRGRPDFTIGADVLDTVSKLLAEYEK